MDNPYCSCKRTRVRPRLQTLFRILELDSGSIMIDGVDISRLGLKKLRGAISILPQVRDPDHMGCLFFSNKMALITTKCDATKWTKWP